MPPLLIVPGRGGSGPEHWQSWLQATVPGARRVEQQDWDNPVLAVWARQFDHAARQCREAPLVVAHSFGCLTLAAAVARYRTPVAGAFLVAPADPDRFDVDDREVLHPLGFASTLIASTNDPWLNQDRVHTLSTAWGSRLQVLGACGHINVDAGFGPWPQMLAWVTAARSTARPLAELSG